MVSFAVSRQQAARGPKAESVPALRLAAPGRALGMGSPGIQRAQAVPGPESLLCHAPRAALEQWLLISAAALLICPAFGSARHGSVVRGETSCAGSSPEMSFFVHVSTRMTVTLFMTDLPLVKSLSVLN